MGSYKRPTVFVLFLMIASLVLDACALSHRAIPVLEIVEPHDRDVVPLHQQVNVRVNVADIAALDPASGWISYEYTITDNDVIIAHIQNETIRQRHLWVVQNNPEPGAHFVLVTGRAARQDPDYADVPNDTHRLYSQWYTSNQVCYWVGPDQPPDYCSVRTIAQPVRAATPTPSPIPPTPVPVIDSASAYPTPVYYGDTCPALSSVTFRAVLRLPQGAAVDDLVVQAHVGVVIGSLQSNSGGFVVPLSTTHTWDTATGNPIFTGVLDLSHAYHDGANQFEPAALGAASGALLWYVDASRFDATLQSAVYLGRSGNQVINLAPCPSGAQPRPHDSNNGTGSGATGCESYSNQLSCNLAGCSWNPQANSCSVNP